MQGKKVFYFFARTPAPPLLYIICIFARRRNCLTGLTCLTSPTGLTSRTSLMCPTSPTCLTSPPLSRPHIFHLFPSFSE